MPVPGPPVRISITCSDSGSAGLFLAGSHTFGAITKREVLTYTRQFTKIDEELISHEGMHEVSVRYNQAPYRSYEKRG